jgi:hypothetical protein
MSTGFLIHRKKGCAESRDDLPISTFYGFYGGKAAFHKSRSDFMKVPDWAVDLFQRTVRT